MAVPRMISRRQALRILAVSSVGSIALRLGAGSLDNSRADIPPVVHESHLLMGTVLNLTLVGDDPSLARAAAAAALTGMRRLAGVCSRFDPASQLSQLNAQGVLRSPDPALVAILQQADAISRASQGAFDVSVKPLLDSYLTSRGRGLPTADAINSALKKVDYTAINCDNGEIGLAQPGMQLTLDGIAKGAVVDCGVSILGAHGFGNVIVEAGGDLLAAGTHGVQTPWRVGLAPPRVQLPQAMPALHIRNRAVATSGDYLQAFAPDYSAHHILDPRRGISAPDLASVTVVAPTALLADALATAVMVAGPRAGLELLQRFPGCEAYLVDKHLQTTASLGMDAYLA